MRNLWDCKKVVVLGGGTAGWFAALEMRRLFSTKVEITVVESKEIGIIGAGEGSVPNFLGALQRYGIDVLEYMRETQSTYKLGVSFEGWRTGEKNDGFYHLFSVTRDSMSLRDWTESSSYPLAAAMLNKGIPFDAYPTSRRLIEARASQQEVAAHLANAKSTEYAYHFDARRLADYLRKVATSRGVKRIDAIVKDVQLDENGDVLALRTDSESIKGDFFIDASGMRRLIVGKTLGSKWRSFSAHLTLDRGMPFFMPLPEGKNVPLVTRAIALNAGWMWVIPTQGRLGCGYVYSSAHTSEEDAITELSRYWGQSIEPVNRIKFEAGQFERVWIGNVMAVGLSSGFVEPLEATSIGQTLSQLAYFGDLMIDCQGVIPHPLIDRFNTQVAAYWDGLLDFLLLHYESQRGDTEYWRDVADFDRPKRYEELLQAFKLRTPRDIDFSGHAAGNGIMFGALSWMLVGAPLGVIPANAGVTELTRLSTEKQGKMRQFLDALAVRNGETVAS